MARSEMVVTKWWQELVAGSALLCAALVVMSGALLASGGHPEWSGQSARHPLDLSGLSPRVAPHWFSAFVTSRSVERAEEPSVDLEDKTPSLNVVVEPGPTMAVMLELSAPSLDSSLAEKHEVVDSITFVIPSEAVLDAPDQPCEYGVLRPSRPGNALFLSATRMETGDMIASIDGSTRFGYRVITCKVHAFEDLQGSDSPLPDHVRLRYTVPNAEVEVIGREYRQRVEANSIYGLLVPSIQTDPTLRWLTEIPIHVSIEAANPGGPVDLLGVTSEQDAGGRAATENGSESVAVVVITWTPTWLVPLLAIMRDGGLAFVGAAIAMIAGGKSAARGPRWWLTLVPGAALAVYALVTPPAFAQELAAAGVAVGVFLLLVVCRLMWRPAAGNEGRRSGRR